VTSAKEGAMKSILMLLCGAFCVVGGMMHTGFGLPALHSELAKTNVSAQLAQELSIFWAFMGAAMVTFGGILLTCGLRMRRKDYSGSAMALWVAACLILYDAAAMVWYGKLEPHFFAFVVLGVIVVFSAIPERKRATS
jgi:hypothetical protein